MIDLEMRRTGIRCVEVSLSELLQLSQVAKNLLSLSRIKSSHTGLYSSRLLERGMEFAESRRYHMGDDVRNIDWKVTARSGKPHTKLFAAEKERQVLLLVDMRSSMFFATLGVFKSVQAALMAGLIGWSSIQTGNRLGGMIFDDLSHFEYRPALGKKALLPVLEQLAKSGAYNSARGTKSLSNNAMDAALYAMMRHISPGSLLFVLSDFRQLSAESCDMLMQMSRHADIRLCSIYDPLEAELPKNGEYPVTDGALRLDLNTSNREGVENYRKKFLERTEKLVSLGAQPHIRFMTCKTSDNCFEILRENLRL